MEISMLKDEYWWGGSVVNAHQMPYSQKSVCKVNLPEGKWTEQNTNETYVGPCKIKVDAPLETLPWFIKNNG